MWRLVIVVSAGCTVQVASPPLAIEPSAIELTIDPAVPPPPVALVVREGDDDVTALASWSFAGRTLGTLDAAGFTSDGRTGGATAIVATIDGRQAQIAATVRVVGRRSVAGLPPGASDWLDAATPVAVDAQLEPGDGAVLPPGLGHLDVDFAADDADDVHRVAITAPYLDLAIDAPGAPGPRHLELTPAEWAAVAATAPSATLSVASTHDGDATARVASATIALCDLPIGPLAFSGAPVDATGTLTAGPQLYRYDPAAAQTVPFVAAPAGGCIGCHESISADGTRIAAAGIDNGLFVGMIIDTQRQTIATISDDKAWTTAAFDPSGALVTAFEGGGQLALRDASGAMISAIATGEPADSPAISPDGSALAYVALPTPSDTMVGTALRVRPWSAASAQVGAPITLATAADAVSPTFSRDGAWIAYAITAGTESELAAATAIVRADGSAPPIAVSAGMGDGYLRWVSPFASARVGGAAPEPMAWLAMASHRTIGGRALAGSKQELWLVPFYPARGAVGRPVHLPGQPAELATLHTPLALAQ